MPTKPQSNRFAAFFCRQGFLVMKTGKIKAKFLLASVHIDERSKEEFIQRCLFFERLGRSR
jgi:hypothetical protein